MVSCLNRRRVLIFLLAWMVLGCAKGPNTSSSAQLIFFQMPHLKLHDAGFIKTSSNKTSLEIFNAGSLLLELEASSNRICINKRCYAKQTFNRQFFENLDIDFEDILQAKPILNGQNQIITNHGFSQTIALKVGKLYYRVSNQSIEFQTPLFKLKISPLLF